MDQIILIALALTSIVSLAFIVERGFALRWNQVIPPAVQEAMANCRSATELPMLQRICEQRPSPLSRLAMLAAEHLDWPKGENAEMLQTRAHHEIVHLERGLVVLEIVTGVAPLMGLVGTIVGLIALFANLDQAGQGDNTAFAKGIAVALNATLLGLVTAIPSLVAWSYYSKKVENLAVEMESLCEEFLRRQYRSGEKS
jgi:biopolymer transport protein ExbB